MENQQVDNQTTLIIPSEQIPEFLPIIPISHRPLFPGMMIPIVLTGDKMLATVRDIVDSPSKAAGVVLAKAQSQGQNISESLYSVGVAIKVLRVAPIDDTTVQVMVNALSRFTRVKSVQEDPIIRWQVAHHSEIPMQGTESKAYSMAIISLVKDLIKSNSLFQEELKLFLNRFTAEDTGKLSDFVAAMTSAEPHELQDILETFDVKKRVEKVLQLLKKELELSRLREKITKQIDENIAKNQKEFFLRQQLKEIKKELGIEKDEKTSEVEKFEERASKLKFSEEAKKRFDEELEKIKVLEPHSAEYGVSRNYLDWLTALPWGIYSDDNYDIKKAARILDRDHFGLEDIKERILEFISTGKMKGKLTGSIICFVGPPGVGKTSIGKSVAEALNRKFFRFSLGGMRDEAEIKGHRRTYIGAMPGKIIQSLKQVGTSNPVIMLDEIDKIGASFQGDPASALLEVLDPEQNSSFLDHYLDVPFDLSNILFIATANQLDTIPLPLMDRMEIMKLSGYILEEKLQIAKRYLIPKQLREHGFKKGQVSINNAALKSIIDGYAREAGVRSLENSIRKIMRKSARRFAEGDIRPIAVTPSSLENFLGKPRFQDESKYLKKIPGVVMGLAWTSLGGTTLYVESTMKPSKSKGFKQTGQLGDVMRESSEIAYTYISSRAKQFGFPEDLFETHFVHLHVPAGATPKDGPSAGVAILSAVTSLLTGKRVRSHVAMTGEITLRGLVLPVGGIKEKVLAAARAGIREVILPSRNEPDLDDLPQSVRDKVTFHLVHRMADVLKLALGIQMDTEDNGAPK